MYYSQVNSPEGKRKMQYRSKGKSCGYYMRIVFFFSSLIQSLIIVSLVLFLLYGNTKDTAVGDRVRDLEESFSRLSIENVALRLQRKNLTNLLNVTLTKKAKIEYDLWTLRLASNTSIFLIQDFHKKLQMCNSEFSSCKMRCNPVTRVIAPPSFPAGCNCGVLVNQIKFVESNFSESVKKMSINMEQLVKEKDKLVMEAIRHRREKSTLEKELDLYKHRSKEEFSQLLSSVSTVTKALLEKIDSLFPRHIAFQLTCPKQRDHLEQIHTNCTSLSREVEDKLQRYLTGVGEQLSNMQEQNQHLKAENWRLSFDYSDCDKNRTAIIEQNEQSSNELQKKHDEEKERLLVDKMKLNGEIEVLTSSVKYRMSEVADLNEKLKQLNMSCMLKTGLVGGFSGGLGPQPGTSSQSGWAGLGGGSSSSASSSSTSLGSTGSGISFNSGFGFNKPGATGAGSYRSTIPQSGSSSGLSNTGSGSSKPASTGGVLSNFGLGPSLGSSWIGSNKPAESGRSSTDSRSSSGLTGSSKSGSTSSGLSSTSYGGTGSSGGGKVNGLASDSAGGITQHIQTLQRLINPSAPQEKQDLSRMLG